MLNAVLFKSNERFPMFKRKLSEFGINCIVLDFDSNHWIDFDYSSVDFIIYYPSFMYSSTYPLALYKVHDNLMFISSRYPKLRMFPDPKLIEYYNDKYKQYLFLKSHHYPTPLTYPLFSEETLDAAQKHLGYPMVIKNRFGSAGNNVFKVLNKRELLQYYRLSTFNFCNLGAMKYFLKMLRSRLFYYHLIKVKKMSYPFLSPPLLAQKFIKHDRDLKTVIRNGKVVEAHWRIKADEAMWKVNIDGGGIGEWSKIPQEAIDLSERLADELKVIWLNMDIIRNNEEYLITEFSPIWHHYAYKEKPTFVYKEDYNINTPLEISLDLERMIVESMIEEKTSSR